jgi:hypothetical protein
MLDHNYVLGNFKLETQVTLVLNFRRVLGSTLPSHAPPGLSPRTMIKQRRQGEDSRASGAGRIGIVVAQQMGNRVVA